MSQSEDFSLDFSGEVEGTEQAQGTITEGVDSSAETSIPEEQNLPSSGDTPPTDSSPISEADSLRQQLAEAMGVLAQYKQRELEGTPGQQNQSRPAPSEVATPSPLQSVAPGQVAQVDFLQGQDHVAILEDPAKFNNLLCTVATTAFNAAVTAAQEQIMLRIPSIVSSSAQQQMAIENVTRDFYAANQDLVNFKQAVSMAAMQLYQENPNLLLPDLLSQAAARTREILHLKGINPGGKRVPAQPAGNSVRGGVDRSASEPQLSDQQKQILELLDF